MIWFFIGGIIMMIQSVAKMLKMSNDGYKTPSPIAGLFAGFVIGAGTYGTILWLILGLIFKIKL